MTDTATQVGRGIVLLGGAVVAVAAGYVLFVELPAGSLARLLGILLVVATAIGGIRATGRWLDYMLPAYNVAEVAVEGPITRDGSGVLPAQPGGTPADDIVEQIERADEEPGVEALLVKLNTPGGEVVPSDDIRNAAASFDGPAVAYATDTCASGGYWIASGCDEFWARDASVVGSIGVILSQVKANELADKVGLTYEGFKSGKYKDAGTPLKELGDDEREYFQGLTDDIYEKFVERVTEGRDLDEALVRDTEARVFLGEEAHELGLVDELGDRAAVEDHLEAEYGLEDVVVEEFRPERRFADRLRMGGQALAYAFGAGVAGALTGDDDPPDVRI